MLRLDPAHPPAWRDESTLQFGLDPVLVLRDPEPWQEILLHALSTGITAADAAAIAGGYGVPAVRTSAFLERLRPLLIAPDARRRVLLDVADTLPHPVAADAAQILAPQFELVREPLPGTTVVLLAAYAVHPARVQAVLRENLTHLPVVVSGDRATVGPLLVPGHGACLGCVAAHRREADPAWPRVAAQLLSRPAPPLPAGLLAESLGLAARLLTDRAGSRAHSHAVTISAQSLQRRWDALDVHPECGCRSPEESGNAGAAPVRIVPPTTTRAYARPA